MEQIPNTQKLDDHLKEIVQALHGTVNWAKSRQNDPPLVDKRFGLQRDPRRD
jgi:hypothetical protein